MSFSMLEPEEKPTCACFYVEASDTMDRDDCPFHNDLIEEAAWEEPQVERKRPEALVGEGKKDAA